MKILRVLFYQMELMSEISRSAETTLSVKTIKMAYFSIFRSGFRKIL